MRQGIKRYLAEVFLCLLAVCAVVCTVIGFRYRSYQEEMERTAILLESEDIGQDIFQILKGEGKISEREAKALLESYGYEHPDDSEAGRQFLKDCKAVFLSGLFLWLVFAGILGFEQYRKRKEREKLSQKIATELEKIQTGEYGQPLSVLDAYMEDPRWKRILDGLDSLGSYVDMIRSQAHREKEETKSLVTDLSHQLKTPVAALTSCFDVLKNPDLSEEERREFQNRMELQLQSLEQLINALVNISRMETGMIELHLMKNRIFDTILEAVNRSWIKARKKEIEIQMESEDEMEDLMIRHDRKWLSEALINLLDNAVKYSPSGSMITLRTVRMTSFLRIEVQDQGIGIPKEHYHKVFQRFFRGNQPEVQNQEGAGVGLYLSRKIIEGHHGTISLDTRNTKKGKGTVFVVQIPY